MPNVIVYTTPTCPYCIKAKEFLKERGIEYQEMDVTRNEAALKDMVEKTGQMGVPVIEIDGDIVVGFDKPKLAKLLDIK